MRVLLVHARRRRARFTSATRHSSCRRWRTIPTSAPISAKLKALLRIAASVQRGGRNVSSADVAAARAEGATDLEIHDTVLIAAVFCMANRYVDGLATWPPTTPSCTPGPAPFAPRTVTSRLFHRRARRSPQLARRSIRRAVARHSARAFTSIHSLPALNRVVVLALSLSAVLLCSARPLHAQVGEVRGRRCRRSRPRARRALEWAWWERRYPRLRARMARSICARCRLAIGPSARNCSGDAWRHSRSWCRRARWRASNSCWCRDPLALDAVVVSGTFNPASKLESSTAITTVNPRRSSSARRAAPRNC